MYPVKGLLPEEDEPSGDQDAAEMNRLRGAGIVQAAETEAVLTRILALLDPSDDGSRPAGPLLAGVRKRLDPHDADQYSRGLDMIAAAIKRRNRLVHDTVLIGYIWQDYATGDGEHVPVISLLGDANLSEADLREDLDLQQCATQHAVEIYHHVKHRSRKSEEARYCDVCSRKT
jgi:hypothetical protein